MIYVLHICCVFDYVCTTEEESELDQNMPMLCLVFTGTDKQASMNERAQAYIPRSSMVSPAEMYMAKGGMAHGMRPPPAETSMKRGMGMGTGICRRKRGFWGSWDGLRWGRYAFSSSS